MFSSMFSNSAAGNGASSGTRAEQPDQRPNADQVFGDVFEDVRRLLSPIPIFTLLRMRNATQRQLTPLFFFRSFATV